MELIKLWEANLEKAYQLQNSFLQEENGFVNVAYGLSLDEFKEYVNLREDYSKGINLKEGYVPDTVYILVDEDEYVGIFNLRHELNDFLRNGAGHIGYAISSKHRQKGYATKGLALVLEKAREIGIDEAYLSVNKDNIGSLKAQFKNGAKIHHEDDKEYYTRIQL